MTGDPPSQPLAVSPLRYGAGTDAYTTHDVMHISRQTNLTHHCRVAGVIPDSVLPYLLTSKSAHCERGCSSQVRFLLECGRNTIVADQELPAEALPCLLLVRVLLKPVCWAGSTGFRGAKLNRMSGKLPVPATARPMIGYDAIAKGSKLIV